jgi:carboxyl-terminal processing protease
MPLRNLAWLVVVPALVALGLAISYSAPAPDKDYQRVRKVVDVMAEVDANFYRKLTDDEWKQFTENMINGGLHDLDKHSVYLNAEQLKQFETDSEGSFGGVGIVLTIDPATKFLKVGRPMPGTPAYEAGVLAGDLIVKAGDKSTEGLTIPDARKLITGEPGTTVALTIRRAGRDPAEEVVPLTRGVIPTHPVSGVRRRADDPGKWEWFIDRANGIGYVHVVTFNELTTKELKAAVEEIARDGGKALVLDLRGNGGGLLNQAIDVCSLFLPEGKPVVSTRGRDPGKTRDFTAKKGFEIFKPAGQHPVVVLMNDQSASASEIVASALQDNKRAAVVGERSYGKGSVQKLLRLDGSGEDKAAVKLTTETYWRPNGENMDRGLATKDKPDEWGVRPDVEVKSTPDEKLRYELERDRADWVAGNPAAVGANPPAWAPPALPKDKDGKPVVDLSKPFEDKPLNAAIDVLKKKLREAGAAPPRRLLPDRIAG